MRSKYTYFSLNFSFLSPFSFRYHQYINFTFFYGCRHNNHERPTPSPLLGSTSTWICTYLLISAWKMGESVPTELNGWISSYFLFSILKSRKNNLNIYFGFFWCITYLTQLIWRKDGPNSLISKWNGKKRKHSYSLIHVFNIYAIIYDF